MLALSYYVIASFHEMVSNKIPQWVWLKCIIFITFFPVKLFSGKSEVGIVLFGTPETDNGLATEDGGYDNISVVQQLVPPAIDMLKLIKGQIEMKGENQADCILTCVLTKIIKMID